eukprot:CAMPEP_0115874102 /NCGR_PEP_ID=MMETSP0287-20121206/24356_1 /TAXON_ID=412157 /ORGANISM="Chrysochromulina rotalis, Strain UIO044" /LENGTH=52 /DNA_ID=CAMNT_0003329219 /DNA_START=44 /DNA_END=198 /DNA_ORIENTATION=-
MTRRDPDCRVTHDMRRIAPYTPRHGIAYPRDRHRVERLVAVARPDQRSASGG